MAQLNFQTLSFELKGEMLKVNLLNIFSTRIPLKELGKIGPFKFIDKNTIEFVDTYEHKAEKKFSFLLSKYFDGLVNTINGNKAIYVHQNSGIPLIGSVSFGIVYRNTSLIEIKPITSCNLNCIYCSVGEGKNSDKVDYVVEKDYLVEGLQELLNFVVEPVEVHIGVQGEPFLYADLIPLIEDLQENKQIRIVSMDSNFTLVNKKILDKLSKFDKLRLNVSLDAMDPKLAEEMAGCDYKLDQVLEMIKYSVSKGIKILIAPVYLPGYNDKELEKITEFVEDLGVEEKENHPLLGVQNFLNYKTGRNPVKAVTWREFYSLLEAVEKGKKIKLKLTPERFGIKKTKPLPKPFKEEDVVTGAIKARDRFANSCLVVAKGRVISVPNCVFREGKKVKVKITRDKHNIFNGKLL
ncbi:radical SAM protein [Candidatus Woesearchaeota archaeon]|nr:radical SAM protein [Candidatus Woesearchaeota archaeon]